MNFLPNEDIPLLGGDEGVGQTLKLFNYEPILGIKNLYYSTVKVPYI
jgi:hypothetical protein